MRVTTLSNVREGHVCAVIERAHYLQGAFVEVILADEKGLSPVTVKVLTGANHSCVAALDANLGVAI